MRKKRSWDIFISHASEDKKDFVRPLALALRRRGVKVWYDEFSLTAGDSLRKSIETGLSNSSYGLVILSPSFFKKKWPDEELSALYSRHLHEKKKVIIPIWYKVGLRQVKSYSILLADLLAIPSGSHMHKLVDRILDELNLPDHIDLNKTLPTGIPRLDKILRGGLPKPSSVVLEGPKGIGKTTLAIQIQIAALDRGLPCVYITYRESPYDIINLMKRLGVSVEDYATENKFRILDNFSASSKITKKEVDLSLPPVLRKAIVRVDNPLDREQYYKLQVKLMDSMGMGGINVIDSINERYKMLQPSIVRDKAAMEYFQRFKVRLSTIGGQSAIHIATGISKDRKFNKILHDLEEGVIRLRYKKSDGERHKVLRIEAMKNRQFDDRWYEFVIADSGIDLISLA